MAAEYVCDAELTDSAIDLLDAAKQRSFTFQGEMFSAFELNSLATETLACFGASSQVKDFGLFADDVERLDCIRDMFLNNHLLLVAYDADKDNTPCSLHGARAHWAVVKGIVLPTRTARQCENGDTLPLLQSISRDALSNLRFSTAAGDDAIDVSRVMLVCQHAKSKRAALWYASVLFASSAQVER
jgi:hypothetical protein